MIHDPLEGAGCALITRVFATDWKVGTIFPMINESMAIHPHGLALIATGYPEVNWLAFGVMGYTLMPRLDAAINEWSYVKFREVAGMSEPSPVEMTAAFVEPKIAQSRNKKVSNVPVEPDI